MPVAALFGGGEKLNTDYSNFHQLQALDIDQHEVNFQDLDNKVRQPGLLVMRTSSVLLSAVYICQALFHAPKLWV